LKPARFFHQRSRICAYAHIFCHPQCVRQQLLLAASPVPGVTCVAAPAFFSSTIPSLASVRKSLKTLTQERDTHNSTNMRGYAHNGTFAHISASRSAYIVLCNADAIGADTDFVRRSPRDRLCEFAPETVPCEIRGHGATTVCVQPIRALSATSRRRSKSFLWIDRCMLATLVVEHRTE
jgi:hypothetical protein